MVNTVEEKQWFKVPLDYIYSQNKNEQRNFEMLMDFPIESLHFYCETADITRVFPSVHTVTEYPFDKYNE
jgi:hypothetical protein